MTHDQTTPAPVDVTLKPCPFCGGEGYTIEAAKRWFVGCFNCYCNVGEAYDISAYPEHMFATEAEAIAAWNTRHSAPAGQVEPVLRWEGDSLYLGDVAVGEVWRGLAQWGWVLSLGAKVTEGFVSTKTEARTAAEQAVRDWLARAGLYTHPAPPADLVERIERLDLLQETNLPNGKWDLETFRATLALCKRHLSTAKHGGA